MSGIGAVPIGQAVASIGFGEVGSIILGHVENTKISPGAEYAGATISSAGFADNAATAMGVANNSAYFFSMRDDTVLSGTWRAMSYTISSGYGSGYGIFQRVY